MKFLGVIPARAGSKRVPGKNTRLLGDTPLLAYTIRAAQESTLLDDFFVSTEDPQIETLAHSYGSPVLIRPKALARDDSTTGEVAAHAVEAMKVDGQRFDAVVILHPTSPFRTGRHIDEAIDTYINGDRSYLASVEMLPKKTHETVGSVTEEGWIPFAIGQNLFKLNAAIYIVHCQEILESKSHTAPIGLGSTPYIMDHQSSLDIDDELDWRIAEMVIRARSR